MSGQRLRPTVLVMLARLTRLDALRAGTREAHARIETVPALARLLAPGLTVAGYVRVLRQLHGFHARLEPVIAARLAGLAEAQSLLDGARLGALGRDLAWFGVAPDQARAPAGGWPELPNLAAALGALYVVEGAGLGARVIGRHLARDLGVADGRGGSYYCGLTAEAARLRWQVLCDMLQCAHPVAEEDLVAGAVGTFAWFEASLRDAPLGDAPLLDAH